MTIETVLYCFEIIQYIKSEWKETAQMKHSKMSRLATPGLLPWRRVLLEKLLFSQLVKKFPSFYGI
jgi:hypothetical protein